MIDIGSLAQLRRTALPKCFETGSIPVAWRFLKESFKKSKRFFANSLPIGGILKIVGQSEEIIRVRGKYVKGRIRDKEGPLLKRLRVFLK